MKVLPLCEESQKSASQINNKTALPTAPVNYAALLWLFCETIKSNGAVSEVEWEGTQHNHRGGLLTLLNNFSPSQHVSG